MFLVWVNFLLNSFLFPFPIPYFSHSIPLDDNFSKSLDDSSDAEYLFLVPPMSVNFPNIHVYMEMSMKHSV
jgi:hypothetical protein